MSHPERVKGRKWGGSLKKIGRCLPMYMDQRHPGDEQEQKQHNLLGRKTIAAYRPTSTGNEDEVQHRRRHSTGSKANPMHIAKDVKELRRGSGYIDVDVFKFSELRAATKHFRPNLILGEGGFGAVYMGVLDESINPKFKKGLEVAVKQLNRNGYQGDREWLTEVNFLGQLSHPNLVKLIGYCCEGEHRLLVYEYMASGSLERHLFRRSSTTMDWLRRIKVALDAAKCLSYLHGLEHSIIYRDLKAANVLLDANFNAKLSDFGLAKEGPMGDETHVSTRVMGTYGYAAPEYMMTGRLTSKSDVYSFGVVLMELLIGRRVVEKSKGASRDRNLVEICRPVLNNSKKLPRILDKRIDGQYSIRAMMRVANLAYQCLSSNPKVRPMMRQVVQILETVHGDEENSRADSEQDEEKATKEEEDERKNRPVVEEVMETNKSDSGLGVVRSRSEPEIDEMLDDEE